MSSWFFTKPVFLLCAGIFLTLCLTPSGVQAQAEGCYINSIGDYICDGEPSRPPQTNAAAPNLSTPSWVSDNQRVVRFSCTPSQPQDYVMKFAVNKNFARILKDADFYTDSFGRTNFGWIEFGNIAGQGLGGAISVSTVPSDFSNSDCSMDTGGGMSYSAARTPKVTIGLNTQDDARRNYCDAPLDEAADFIYITGRGIGCGGDGSISLILNWSQQVSNLMRQHDEYPLLIPMP